MRKQYTVVGIYCDNEQGCCWHVEATDPAEAIAAAARKLLDMPDRLEALDKRTSASTS